ncbi:PQQ-binding-like beta-propeller repeat protein [Streptomyces sp. CC224B]|uniref:outer membrane protein assembly factor BamB family protein n=1 Tax=Streptomyces sp. CC224B TaxID=3044571 RepID=UPI0024A980D2|nr:PQQ-binding-like beta-propeller repeat protein [Streptomyces sp. CC224B]
MSQGPPRSQFTQSVLAEDSARRQRRTRLLAGTAGLLALVLCTGGWMLWSATDDEADAQDAKAVQQAPDDIRDTVENVPRSPAGRLIVDYREKEFGKRRGADASVPAPGTWATDRTLVRGVGDQLKGFTFGTPEEAWSTDLGGPICDTTRHVTADGRTAVLVQERAKDGDKGDGGKSEKSGKSKGEKDSDEKKGKKSGKPSKGDKGDKGKGDKKGKGKGERGKKRKPTRPEPPATCDRLVFVDLNTGKKLWQAKLPEARTAFAPNTNVTMVRGTVTVAWGDGSVAYDMAGGERLWASTSASACGDAGFAGGRALLALRRCGDGDDRTYRVQKVDPRTGDPEWTYKVDRGIRNVYLVSSEPAVIAVAAGDGDDGRVTGLITLDDRGAYRSTVDMPEGRYMEDCSVPLFGTVETCHSVAVGRDQLFLATARKGSDANGIVSFDLTTGKAVRTFDSRGRGVMYPLEVSGGKLLAFRGSGNGVDPDAVVSLDPETGKERPFLLFGVPEGAGPVEPGRADVVVEGGRVFIAPKELRAAREGDGEGAAYGALGIEGA